MHTTAPYLLRILQMATQAVDFCTVHETDEMDWDCVTKWIGLFLISWTDLVLSDCRRWLLKILKIRIINNLLFLETISLQLMPNIRGVRRLSGYIWKFLLCFLLAGACFQRRGKIPRFLLAGACFQRREKICHCIADRHSEMTNIIHFNVRIYQLYSLGTPN